MINDKINLCVMIKDCTSDYMLKQFCIYYSKYSIEKVFYLIHAEEKTNRINELVEIIESHFDNTEQTLSLYDLYNVEEEGIYFTNVYNYKIPQNQWLLIVDVDEFIQLEKIPENYFNEFDVIKGLLIDRIGNNFNPSKSLFENYPDNYFLHGIINTSYPRKIPLIRKKDVFVRINSGHHEIFLDKNDFYQIKAIDVFLPVFHFKWRHDTISFLKKGLNGNKDNRGSRLYNKEIVEQIGQLENGVFYKEISKGLLPNGCKKIKDFNLIYELWQNAS